MSEEFLIAFCTFPDNETARKITHELVQLRLVACGNILPQVQSIYRWKDGIETSGETLGLFKLTANCYAKFEAKLQALHPYEVPEIISCKIERGLPDYLRWIGESCEGFSE